MLPANEDICGQASLTMYTDITIGERFPSPNIMSCCCVVRVLRGDDSSTISSNPHLKLLSARLCSLSDPGDTVDTVTMLQCSWLDAAAAATYYYHHQLPSSRSSGLLFVLCSCYPDLSSWADAAEIILSWLSVMRGFIVFLTISMIGAGAGSSTTDQIIANNKHSLGRNFEEGRW